MKQITFTVRPLESLHNENEQRLTPQAQSEGESKGHWEELEGKW